MLGIGKLCKRLARLTRRDESKRAGQAQAAAPGLTLERETGRLLLRYSSDGIHFLDAAGNLVQASDSFCEMLGYQRGEMLGMNVRAWDARTDVAALEASLPRSLAANGPVRFDAVHRRKDGSCLDVEVSMTAIRVDGRPLLFCSSRDVGERKSGERRLRRAESDLRSILDQLPAIVGSWDRDLRTRFCNERFREWQGVDPAAVQGKDLRHVLGDAFFREHRHAILGALKGKADSFEHTQNAAGAKIRHAQVTCVPDCREGEPQGFYMFAFDVTRQKEIELALQQGLRLHDAIFTHAGVGIACVREGHFERVSHRCTELLGYDEGELDDMPAARIFPDADAERRLGALARKLMSAGETVDLELPLRRKDGADVWCRMMQRAIDPQDLAQGAIWVIDDFSDRKQRETLLREARASAEDAARLKAEFLANMSHEIRTPMNAVIGMTHLALDGQLEEAQRENLHMVLESAEALLGIINDILDFSKLEAGKMQLAPVDFDLRSTLATTLQHFAPEVAKKGVELVLDVAADVPEQVHADSLRLMQIVTNFVSNAIKFTPTGEVTCQVRAEDAPGGEVLLRIAVRDTGVGIAESVRERIFESFVQADSSVTRQFGGTGLGLAICRQTAKLMNCRIDVESELGAGSTFSFAVRAGRRTPPPALGADEAAILQNKPVVLALANLTARAALAAQLRAWQLRPIEFAALGDALAACTTAVRHRAPYPVLVADAALWNAAEPAARAALMEQAGAPALILLGATRDASNGRGTLLRKPPRPAELRAALCVALGAPADSALAQRRPQATAALAPPPRTLRILVAEDHPMNQKLAQRILERRGHTVTLANDGVQALAAFEGGRFDVVLMDVQMPEMDGVAATQAIRRAERATGGHVPIVALTAHALKGERERLLEAGMDDYLSKPYDPALLLRIVERFAQPRAAGENALATG